MFEPVAGALVAYAWLGGELSVPQVTGGAIVLAGILLAQQPAKSPQTAKNSILYKPASTARKVQKLSALQVGLVWLAGYGLPLTS
jgi:hypothetical protein